MTPNSQYHIIVAAPPGGLAKQLSMLIDYAVNESASAPDWAAPVVPDLEIEDIILAQSILDAKDLLGIATESAIPCKFTSLPVSTIRQKYSNCKIVYIDCTRQDYLQMAWIYLVEDCFKSTGQLVVDDYFTNFVKTVHNEPDLDFVELLQDPQSYSDPRIHLLLNLMSRGHKIPPYNISMMQYDPPEQNSQSFLKLNFTDICQPEHGDTSTAVTSLIEFLGRDATRSTENAIDSWTQLMKRISLIQKTN